MKFSIGYTVVDPVIYSEPFTVEMTLNRKAPGEVIYEFALPTKATTPLPSILAAARRAEFEAEPVSAGLVVGNPIRHYIRER